jgi:Cu/Ag efflux protein CusF
MRALFVPALAAALLATSMLAFAADSSTGMVKNFDLNGRTLTLENGTVYNLPSGFKDPGLKIGEKVSISWQMKDGKYMANTVSIQKS